MLASEANALPLSEWGNKIPVFSIPALILIIVTLLTLGQISWKVALHVDLYTADLTGDFLLFFYVKPRDKRLK